MGGQTRGFRSLTYLLVLGTVFTGSGALAAELSLACGQIASKATPSGALYAMPEGGTLQPLGAIELADVRGKTVDFFYSIKRRSDQLSKRRPNLGALSVKSEMWQPGEPAYVHFFNNHRRDDPTACPGRDFAIYQEFHKNGKIDNCMGLAFHNQFGFKTKEPEYRRKRFLFPERSWFDLLFKTSEPESVKRQSGIVNYSNPPDGSPVCVRFQLTFGQEVARSRLVVDDLFEDVENQTVPPHRWERSR